jgi:cytochrome d ubiquinol oxidase subunit II
MNAALPLIFMALMAIAMLAYVILDGYDLGVGVLLRRADAAQKDLMIASIGPFWDANETWLVLGVGLLLVAFPKAHGIILGALYLPVALMLVGLMLRGVAFELRAKSEAARKPHWDRMFTLGSLLAALSQGFMLGHYIVGFDRSWAGYGFALLIAPCLTAGYALLGAGWLILKTEGELQRRAIRWAQGALGLTALGIAAVSLATPMVSARIYDKWFQLPELIALLPIPLVTAALFALAFIFLRRLAHDAASANERGLQRWAWAPFACAVGIYLLAFFGLAYSLYPYLVVDHLTAVQAASAPESLRVILIGTVITLPAIIGYTVFSYRVFWGKARALDYGPSH